MPYTSMATHPPGITIEIVGIESDTQGRKCHEHDICGSVMAEDVVVRFRKVQVIVDRKEQSAIAVYRVSDGIDSYRVGFLQRHLVKHWKQYDGVLVQVIEVYSKESDSPTSRRKYHRNKGCCVAVIISSLNDDTVKEMSQQKRSAESDNEDSQSKRQRTETTNNDSAQTNK